MTAFNPIRVTRSYTMTADAPPAEVFPLLCPVREYEWIEPWSCDMVFSESGLAESNAVFRTRFPAQGGEETWIVCRYEKDRAIAFIRLVPGFKVNRLDIDLTAASDRTARTVSVHHSCALIHHLPFVTSPRRRPERRARAILLPASSASF